MANLELFKKYKNNKEILVETGTWTGDGISKAFMAGYKKVYSCDINEDNVIKAKEKYINENVTIIALPSQIALKEIMNEIKEPCVIFLDGHIMPKMFNDESLGFDEKQLELITKNGVKGCPLIEELAVISAHTINTHTILIDDYMCFNTWIYDYLKFEEIISIMTKINKDYKFYIESNVACFYV